MDDDSLYYHHYEPIQSPKEPQSTLNSFLSWFREKQFLLAVAVFVIAVQGAKQKSAWGVLRLSDLFRLLGPIYRWIHRNSISTFRRIMGKGRRIDAVVLLLVLECFERTWSVLAQVLQRIISFFGDIVERRRYPQNTRRNQDLPDLVCDDDEEQAEKAISRENCQQTEMTNDTASEPLSRQIADAIEPTFLNEDQYPKDWLVYHPVLRVVLKTEADRYDRGESIEESDESGSGTEEKKDDQTERSNSTDLTAGHFAQKVERKLKENREMDIDRLGCPHRGSTDEGFRIQHSVAAN